MTNSKVAQGIFDKIGTGKGNAVKRPANAHTDRALRRMIEQAQGNGDIIITAGDGAGYFRPDFSDPEEAME